MRHSLIRVEVIFQFAELKRLERDHQKEKQKLIKDKDAGMSASPIDT